VYHYYEERNIASKGEVFIKGASMRIVFLLPEIDTLKLFL